MSRKFIKTFLYQLNLRTLLLFLYRIKIYKGVLYFVDLREWQVQMVDLEKEVKSSSGFGPRIFYRPTSLSLFSSSYYTKHIGKN